MADSPAKKPVVYQATCIGCGTCTVIAAKTFILNDEGKAEVADPAGNTEAEIQEAIESCPVTAIKWQEE